MMRRECPPCAFQFSQTCNETTARNTHSHSGAREGAGAASSTAANALVSPIEPARRDNTKKLRSVVGAACKTDEKVPAGADSAVESIVE